MTFIVKSCKIRPWSWELRSKKHGNHSRSPSAAFSQLNTDSGSVFLRQDRLSFPLHPSSDVCRISKDKMNILYRTFLNIRKHHLLHKNRRKLLRNSLFLTATGIGGITAVQPNSTTTVDGIDIVAQGGSVIRFLRSLSIGLTISLDYYFSMLGLNEECVNYAPMISRVHYRAAKRILDGCLQNGGTYIKMGQGLVSLSHILPKEYVEVLTALQDKCLSRGSDELEQIFVEEFGKSPQELFENINTDAIAAASLAQVFKAVTRDGQKVAVKVQYIDLQRRFISDVSTIRFLLKVAGFVHPDFSFDWILKDLSESLRQELDFTSEGKNAERCAADLKHLSYVYVPKIRWELSSKRILVTEFIDGIKINQRGKLERQGFSLREIDEKVIEAFGHQIFQTGFVHADPHPGNILIRKSAHNKTEIVLLDHGLYQELSEAHKIALSYMWKSIVLQDFNGMKMNAEKLGVADYEVLAEILTQRPLRATGFKMSIRLTDQDLKYMAEAAAHRFDKIMAVLREMPRSLLLVVRNLNTIRAITYDHGDPVDRYSLLARCAAKQAFKEASIYKRVIQIPTEIYFEFKILSGKIWVWLIKSSLNVLRLLGRTADVSQLLKYLN